jgi:endoglucanase Acf2
MQHMQHFDWYLGHSWATGLYSGERNQESSSEAVNAWYGLWLYGKATSASDLTELGGVLLYNEMQAAQAYYHVTSDSTTFKSPFKEHKVQRFRADANERITLCIRSSGSCTAALSSTTHSLARKLSTFT